MTDEEKKKSELDYLNGQNGKALVTQKWKTRRRITLCTLVWMVVKTLLIFYTIPESKLAVLKEPMAWSYMIEGAIITAYFGFKAFAKDQVNQ
jgi:uncharacterized membrane protein